MARTIGVVKGLGLFLLWALVVAIFLSAGDSFAAENLSLDSIAKEADKALNEVRQDYFHKENVKKKKLSKARRSALRKSERAMKRELEEDRALMENWYGLRDQEEPEPFSKKKKAKKKKGQKVKGFQPWDYAPNGVAEIEFNYIRPGWVIESSSKKHGHIIVGMTKKAAKQLAKLRTQANQRCRVKGNFKKKGVYIFGVAACRGVVVADNEAWF